MWLTLTSCWTFSDVAKGGRFFMCSLNPIIECLQKESSVRFIVLRGSKYNWDENTNSRYRSLILWERKKKTCILMQFWLKSQLFRINPLVDIAILTLSIGNLILLLTFCYITSFYPEPEQINQFLHNPGQKKDVFLSVWITETRKG